MNIKRSLIRLFPIICLALVFSGNAFATGPRIKHDLFVRNPNAIYALDFPPFISTDNVDGGLAMALVRKILDAASISASVSSQPLARMLKYYLFEEQALAVVANHIQFRPKQREQLIFVPLLRLKRHYYVHQSKHPQGMPEQSELSALATWVFGANPEEDVQAYTKAGIDVETGNLLSLLEKLKEGRIDFIAEVEPAVDWYLQRNLSADKAQFIRVDPAVAEETIFIVFNKKHAEGESIAKRFQSTLAAFIAEGRYQALLEQYLGGGAAVERYTLPLQ